MRQNSSCHNTMPHEAPVPHRACSGKSVCGAEQHTWVLKMLQEHQRTSAPRAVRLSINTAVCMVICKLPAIRTSLKGCCRPNSLRQAIRPGISASAKSISSRPKSACAISFTLYCKTQIQLVQPFGLVASQRMLVGAQLRYWSVCTRTLKKGSGSYTSESNQISN